MVEFGLLLMGLLFALTMLVARPVVRVLSPSCIFLGMQYIMALGVAGVLDLSVSADRTHWLLIVLAFTAFCVTTIVLSFVEVTARPNEVRSLPGSIVVIGPRPLVMFLFIVSCLICIAYFTAVGYNVLIQGIAGSLTAGDAAVMRRNSYAGSTYFFPGYVNQFKNSLLPALAIVLITWLLLGRRTFRLMGAVALAAVSLVFLMGTGQRGATVTVLIVAVVFAGHLGPRVLKKASVIVLAVGVPVFFLGSIILGRSSAELETAQTPADRILVLGEELVARILDSNQGSAVAAFRYISEEPTVWAAEWGSSIVGLLPGASGVNLSNMIYLHMYGTSQGTAPPSLWGSMFYNVGFIGTLICSMLLALVYFFAGRAMTRSDSTNTLSVIGMAGVATVLGTWIAGGPEYLANSGLIVYMLVWWWGARIVADASKSALPNEPRFSPITGHVEVEPEQSHRSTGRPIGDVTS